MNLLSLTKINRLQKQNMFESCDVICHVTCCILYLSLYWCTDPKHVIHQSMRTHVSYNIYVLNNPQKNPKSWKNLKNNLKKRSFGHARHETFTREISETYHSITIK
jgi:hypothetical protein